MLALKFIALTNFDEEDSTNTFSLTHIEVMLALAHAFQILFDMS